MKMKALAKFIYSDIKLTPSGFSSYKEKEGPVFTNDDPATADSVVNHFTNFIECVQIAEMAKPEC